MFFHYKGFIPIIVCTLRISMNILFVRLSYIGDVLHATPAARWIKEQYPGNGIYMRHILKNYIFLQCGACGGILRPN